MDMDGAYIDCIAAYGVSGAHPGGMALTKQLIAAERLVPGTIVLDAGCGTGQTASLLQEMYGADVTAMDRHPAMVEKAKERLKHAPVHVIRGDIEALPFADETFDLVLSESVLAFTNVERSIPQLQRVLKRDGVLLAIEMTKEAEISADEEAQLKAFYGMPRLLAGAEWESAFHNAGFPTVETVWSGQSGQVEHDGEQPEFILSAELAGSTHEVMAKHLDSVEKYADKTGYRVFRCANGHLA